MPEEGTTGLFGKLPAHGDFVRRGLPRSFIGPWDEWLSAGIEASRRDLGPDWDHAWAAAPAWRFRLAPGACGPDAAVGVMVTSADTVGRRFPLTLAAVLPAAAIPPPEAWFDALEEAASSARTGDVDADGLLARLPAPPPDDPDATLDGRSLFWTAGTPPQRMPLALDFVRLLGTSEVPSQPIIAMPFAVSERGPSVIEDQVPDSLLRPADTGLADPAHAPALPFAEPAVECDLDAAAALSCLDPADGAHEPQSPIAGQSSDQQVKLPDDTYVWAEMVELPWAAAASDKASDPHDPEAGAAA